MKKISLSKHRDVLIRLAVGAVFLSEGIQKFLFPELRGAGRFAEIGLPFAESLGYTIGGLEVLSGALILIGYRVHQVAVVPAMIMLGAIVLTKVPILVDDGFWAMAHHIRTDWAMLLASLYLLLRPGR